MSRTREQMFSAALSFSLEGDAGCLLVLLKEHLRLKNEHKISSLDSHLQDFTCCWSPPMMVDRLPGCWLDKVPRDLARKVFGSPTPATWN